MAKQRRPRKQKTRGKRLFAAPAVSVAHNGNLPLAGAMQSYPHTMAPHTSEMARKPSKWRTWFKRLVLTVLAAVVLIGGLLGWRLYEAAVKATGDKNPLHLFSLLHPGPLKGEDQGRVNILIAGDSSDDPGHAGAQLTDSIMVLSVDTKNHTAFMLSIPRDTWVNIPGIGHEKINAANEDSDFSQPGYPSGGMGQLESIVEQGLGMTIDYYALISYNAFKDAVGAVGGIDVNIQSSDPRGLYDPSIDYATNGPLVKLTNGLHHLDGEQALDLARARGDAYGSYGFPRADLNRTQNQRPMLLALKSKVTSAGVISNPLKLSQLATAYGNNVQTDMTLSNASRLYRLTKPIDNAQIKSYGLDNINGHQLLRGYTSYDGQAALIPMAGVDNFTQIQAVLQQLLTTSQQ